MSREIAPILNSKQAVNVDGSVSTYKNPMTKAGTRFSKSFLCALKWWIRKVISQRTNWKLEKVSIRDSQRRQFYRRTRSTSSTLNRAFFWGPASSGLANVCECECRYENKENENFISKSRKSDEECQTVTNLSFKAEKCRMYRHVQHFQRQYNAPKCIGLKNWVLKIDQLVCQCHFSDFFSFSALNFANYVVSHDENHTN